MGVADTGKTIDEFTEEDFLLLLEKYEELGFSVTVDPLEEYARMRDVFAEGKSWYKFHPDASRQRDAIFIKTILVPRGNNYSRRADHKHLEPYVHAYITPYSIGNGASQKLQEAYRENVCCCFGVK